MEDRELYETACQISDRKTQKKVVSGLADGWTLEEIFERLGYDLERNSDDANKEN